MKATLIPGDGIGPEIMDATKLVLEALGAPFEWEERQAGLAEFEHSGDALPVSTLDSIRTTRLALKGPLSTPSAGGYRSATVRMREAFDLRANVRPARTIVPGRYAGVDIVLVRENLEGLYVGQEHYVAVDGDPRAVGVATGWNTGTGSRAIVRHAFELAVREGRRKVTAVHKANILKCLTGVFLEAAREVAEEYAGRIEFEERIVDACAMQLVMAPERFDVIVTTNLFGDILSDLCAGLVGGLGLAPGANVGDEVAIFEAVHGSAPDIAGQGIANPTAVIMAAGMMLDHVGLPDTAARLRAAVRETLDAGERTADLGGTLDTHGYARAVVSRLA